LNIPFSRENKSDCNTNKSEVDLTGKNLRRGTFTDKAFLNNEMAAPAAVSS
jgi:hypothetical protein